MSTRLQNLRKRAWSSDASTALREIGEALRDLHSFASKLTLCTVIECTNAVWSEPFSIGMDLTPRLVILADARLAGQLAAIDVGAVEWSHELGLGGHRAKISRVNGLQSGTSYDLKFLVVY